MITRDSSGVYEWHVTIAKWRCFWEQPDVNIQRFSCAAFLLKSRKHFYWKLQLLPGDMLWHWDQSWVKYFFEVMRCKSCTTNRVGVCICLRVFVAVSNEFCGARLLFVSLSSLSMSSSLSSPLSASVAFAASCLLLFFPLLSSWILPFHLMLDISLVQKVRCYLYFTCYLPDFNRFSFRSFSFTMLICSLLASVFSWCVLVIELLLILLMNVFKVILCTFVDSCVIIV